MPEEGNEVKVYRSADVLAVSRLIMQSQGKPGIGRGQLFWRTVRNYGSGAQGEANSPCWVEVTEKQEEQKKPRLPGLFLVVL
jgi:hypothetical protein